MAPPILKKLLEGQDPRSKVFKKNIIPINNALSLASLKVRYKSQPQGSYKPQVMIQGKAYYYIGPLQVEEGQAPRFASLYVHDPTMEGAQRANNLYLPRGTSENERRTCESILQDLQQELREHNPYIRDFLQICEIPEE